MARHIPGMLWAWRRIGRYPNGCVMTACPTDLKLEFYPEEGQDGFSFQIRRADAKLLARRITQCLEKTKS